MQLARHAILPLFTRRSWTPRSGWRASQVSVQTSLCSQPSMAVALPCGPARPNFWMAGRTIIRLEFQAQVFSMTCWESLLIQLKMLGLAMASTTPSWRISTFAMTSMESTPVSAVSYPANRISPKRNICIWQSSKWPNYGLNMETSRASGWTLALGVWAHWWTSCNLRLRAHLWIPLIGAAQNLVTHLAMLVLAIFGAQALVKPCW